MMIINEDIEMIRNQMKDSEINFYKFGTILITGCAGSLGYELVSFLRRCGGTKRIIGIDNCCMGYPLWLKKAISKKEIDFYQEDVSKINLTDIPGAGEVTHVFHMASIASPVLYRKDPIGTMDANVAACRNLLDYYKNSKLKVFCLFSSSEIYGSPEGKDIPTKESYWGNVSCIGPRACYDESKRYTETLCYVYGRKYKIPCVILRPFNIFGPGMKIDDGRLPADCARAIIENRNVVIYSDGTPTRTFCYISDAIVWILKAAAYGKSEVFNIGSDEAEISIREFAELNATVGKDSFNYLGKVVFGVSDDPDYLVHNPDRRCPDLTHAKEILCYSTQISTREGIYRYLCHLTEQNAIAGGILS